MLVDFHFFSQLQSYLFQDKHQIFELFHQHISEKKERHILVNKLIDSDKRRYLKKVYHSQNQHHLQDILSIQTDLKPNSNSFTIFMVYFFLDVCLLYKAYCIKNFAFYCRKLCFFGKDLYTWYVILWGTLFSRPGSWFCAIVIVLGETCFLVLILFFIDLLSLPWSF